MIIMQNKRQNYEKHFNLKDEIHSLAIDIKRLVG